MGSNPEAHQASQRTEDTCDSEDRSHRQNVAKIAHRRSVERFSNPGKAYQKQDVEFGVHRDDLSNGLTRARPDRPEGFEFTVVNDGFQPIFRTSRWQLFRITAAGAMVWFY
jgi:hypothetical protein